MIYVVLISLQIQEQLKHNVTEHKSILTLVFTLKLDTYFIVVTMFVTCII